MQVFLLLLIKRLNNKDKSYSILFFQLKVTEFLQSQKSVYYIRCTVYEKFTPGHS